ncbi:MAG: type 1 glutamine amidotransferase domain-containing protein [Proteobacteria bacterium]|nr:type 1 glutamine amidotransferase domain-containing protein [Pseudomonadota bacterium]
MKRFFAAIFSLSFFISCVHKVQGSTLGSSDQEQQTYSLVILSESDFVTTREGVKHPTGYFLSELAGPAIALKKLGHRLIFATPSGKRPTMDQVSNDGKWFKNADSYEEALRFVKEEQGIMTPVSFASLGNRDLSKFESVFVPGGHAPLEDLISNPQLARILNHFHREAKPTALICHGPAALLSAKVEDGWLYAGYGMTAFSSREEKQEEDAGHLDGQMPFYLDAELAKLGAIIDNKDPWQSSSIRHKELITGQNPMSEEEFTGLFLEAIVERKLASVQVRTLNPGDPLSVGVLYSVAQNVFDNSRFDAGYRTLWIGYSNGDSDNFVRRLEPHIELTQESLAPQGLLDYIVYATAGYEIAYQRWTSKEAAEKAFATDSGKRVASDAATFMKPLLYKEIQKNPF